MRRDAFRWFIRGLGLALGAALAVGVVYALLVSARVAVLVFVALLLASGLEPLIDKVRHRTRLGRGATLLAVYAAFFLLAGGVLLLVVPGALGQLAELGVRLNPILDDVREWARTLEPKAVSVSLLALIDAAQDAIAPATAPAPEPDQLIALGLTFAEIVISFIAVLTMIYFWLTERARLQRFALALLPAERRAGARDAWNEIEDRLGAWVRGQLILMGTVGVATTVAYYLIGLEGPLLLGLIAAVAELIPLVGPALGAVPALVVAALTGNVEVVILVAVVYFIIQVVEGNILVPLVMHNAIGIPPLLVFISILVGAAIAGIPGALIAVPLTAALLVIVERLQARRKPVPLKPPEPSEEGQQAVDSAEETVRA